MTGENSSHLIIGTAGHIDHGKSSLIQALTGTDPDRLAEEKRRGITIELGFAQLRLENGSALGVVDVPGHERFVRQMIAGASGIDIALLCIAADDGIMPQTVEHLAVLELLDVHRCVIALTKTDLVDDEWLAFLKEEIREHLASGPFSEAPIVSVSARTGAGLEELKKAIGSVAENVDKQHESKNARLPIDRSFSIKGSGTIVTGTLWSGSICANDKLQAYPGEEIFRVRAVQRHGSNVDRALAGDRVALNLAHAERSRLHRGAILAKPDSLHMSDRFDASFTYLGTQAIDKPFITGERVRVAHGTTEVFGRVLLMQGQTQLLPKEKCLAQIRLDKALPLSRNDRFIVRSMSPTRVIGGGRIVHSCPRRRTTLTANEHLLLEALSADNVDEACKAGVALQVRPATASEIARTTDLPEDAVGACLESMVDARKILALQGKPAHYITRALLQKRTAAIESALLKFHAANPSLLGIPTDTLRALIDERSTTASFDALLAHMELDGGIIAEGGLVSHPKAGAGAKLMEAQAAETLHVAMVKADVCALTTDGLIAQSGLDNSLAYRAIGTLEKQGRACRVGEFCFSGEALDALAQAATTFLHEHGSASAAQLKEAMGTSRKYAIPLLEHFDACGLTRRVGDERRLAR